MAAMKTHDLKPSPSLVDGFQPKKQAIEDELWKDPFLSAEVAIIKAKQNSERAFQLALESKRLAQEANKNAKEAKKFAEELTTTTSCCGFWCSDV